MDAVLTLKPNRQRVNAGSDWVLVNAREERHPEGAYYLESREGNKRTRLSVGNDDGASDAEGSGTQRHGIDVVPTSLLFPKLNASSVRTSTSEGVPHALGLNWLTYRSLLVLATLFQFFWIFSIRSAIPSVFKISGLASSIASGSWHVLQSCVITLPSAVLCEPS